MWDNPRQLNAVAGFLTALALMVFAFAGLQLLLRTPLFPLREIAVRGALAHTTRAEVEQATQGRVSGNFFAVDLALLRASLERLPWVRRVQVRRVWPDRIEATLEEHVALARWSDASLVNQMGERFYGRSDRQALPLFDGPQGSEGEVTRRYRIFAQTLAPLGTGIERLVLSPRHAWQLRLDGGLAIKLGRDAANDPVERRLERFVSVHAQTLAKMQRRHEVVDLRYPNGFALRVPELKGG
ncbi:MAG: FtsQ-type POTRA domain-containing protein [Proteobacteria bacterium]|nr:FtsQ-type POTRA domain-containing protein [Pseudomonadota bacterium]